MLPTGVAASSTAADSGSSVLADPQWGFSAQEQQRLARLIGLGLLQIERVASLPEGSQVAHLGWPIATRLPSGRFVVVYRRASGHTDSDKSAQAGHYVIYSDDLVHWQPQNPIRLGDLPGMHAIGHVTRADGGERLVALTSGRPRCIYMSDDHGVTWKTDTTALNGMLRTAPHTGPNMINHPDFGLVVPFGQENNGGRRNYMIRSTDAGQTWEERVWLNRNGARGFEPTLATWGPGHMVMISREARGDFAIGPDGYFGHSQHVYQHNPGASFRRVKFQTSRTNIIGNPAAESSCHDTAEVIFNPVTERIEMLQSHRWGGGPGRTGTRIEKDPDAEISSLNLWSIDPDALLAGSADWRFDGTVVERIGYSRKGNRDGLHPGGSIIDTDRNMQHIFVYAGWRRTPASLFRISRTLDTQRWREATL